MMYALLPNIAGDGSSWNMCTRQYVSPQHKQLQILGLRTTKDEPSQWVGRVLDTDHREADCISRQKGRR